MHRWIDGHVVSLSDDEIEIDTAQGERVTAPRRDGDGSDELRPGDRVTAWLMPTTPERGGEGS